MPKIYKRLSVIPYRPVTSNCGTRREEQVSEYIDYILKPIMQESWSYVKDCVNKKNIGKVPDGAIVVTAVVVGLYPSKTRRAGLGALRKNKGLHSEI